ncbi:MAG: DUF2628 domain-containing protein [Rubripirellula sp.]
MSDNAHDQPYENPYTAPASTPGLTQSLPTESTEEQHLRAFVGSKAEYYLQKWSPSVEHSGHRTGFNWAAFLLSGLWLPYRKMYRVATIFYAIIIAESIAEEALFVGILGQAETPAVLGRVVGLVAAAVCGTYGNRWYLSHARKVISDVHAQGLEEHAAVEMLSKRGGTSLGSSLGFSLLFMVIVFAVLIVLELLLYAL